MLSFDVTDKQIRIIRGTEAGGRIKVSAAATLNVPEGLISNGHIRDIPQMARLVDDALKNNHMTSEKEAVISLSSNLMVFKELEIPKSKPSQIKQMVTSKMQQTMGVTNDYTISYTIAGTTGNNMQILATACPRDMVEGYRKVFNMLNITLKMVASSSNCISRIVMMDNKLKDKCPALLVQINENFISMDLYEDGRLAFTRFVTIDPNDYDDKEDYVFEAVNDQVFRMFQFQKSRGRTPIRTVMFYGDTSQYIRLTNAMEQMDITTQILKVPSQVGGYENFEFTNFANAIGAMYKRQKETESINLLALDFAAASRTEVSAASAGVPVIIAIVVCAAIVGGAWLFFNILSDGYKSDIAAIDAWMQDSKVVDQLAAVDKAQTAVDKAQSYNDKIRTLTNNYKTFPVIRKQILNAFYDSTKVGPRGANNEAAIESKITAFTFAEGQISASYESENMQNPAAIAAKLARLENFFLAVGYNGYSGASNGSYTDSDGNTYTIQQGELGAGSKNTTDISVVMAGEQELAPTEE